MKRRKMSKEPNKAKPIQPKNSNLSAAINSKSPLPKSMHTGFKASYRNTTMLLKSSTFKSKYWKSLPKKPNFKSKTASFPFSIIKNTNSSSSSS